MAGQLKKQERLASGGAQEKKKWYQHITWRIARPVVVFLCAAAIVLGTISVVGAHLYNGYLSPVDEEDTTVVQVEIKSGWSLSQIAEELVSKDIIRNSGVFKYYVDFMGSGGKMKSGKYELSPSMTMDDVVQALMKGDGKAKTTRFTIPEGSNIQEMATILKNKAIITDVNAFVTLCNDKAAYEQFDFIAALSDQPARRNVLEGYLFPSTYEIYVDATMESIIEKLLKQTESVIYKDVYVEKMHAMNMTVDQVYTLASIIEKEARPADMGKVSAVFHLRMQKNMRLQSCATVQYVLGTKRLKLTNADMSVDSPFNTYKVPGLPAGPITNPGEEAIKAALFPNEEFMAQGYLYFGSKDPASGELYFAKTESEHEKFKAQYEPLWIEHDRKVEGG